jgi:SAM-dependent methyltransferase
MATLSKIYGIKEDGRFKPSSEWDVLKEWAGLAEGSRVLDAGCGRFARDYIALHERGCKVYGMDIDEGALKKAKEELEKRGIPARLVKGDIKNGFPFYHEKYGGRKFDFVYACAIPAKGTGEEWKDVYRLLENGGKAHITLLQEVFHLNPGCEEYDFGYKTDEIKGWFENGNHGYKIEFEELPEATEECERGPRLTKKLLVKIENLSRPGASSTLD